MKNRNIRHLIIFILVITGMSIIYDYPKTLFKRPQSVHNWRQCDGASLALNYYQEGMHFFKPQTHMLYSDNYTTGYTSPSEMPVLYYFVAVLYKIFGYHEFIFRAVNLLLFFIGLFYLFKLAYAALHDLLYSLVVTALIFSSPVLVYYGNNFLPNTVALSFSFAGWYYFYRYADDGKTRSFLVSILFFGIAGILKITELTGPIIILCLLIFERFRIFKLKLHGDNKPALKIISILGIFVIVAGWIWYAKYYNGIHHSSQFSTYTFPIWAMSHDDIAFTLHKMNVIWFRDYFYPATFWLMISCLIMAMVFYRRSEKILVTVAFFYVLALIAFSLLWFQALGDHDYFFTSFYLLPAFLFINFFYVIKRQAYNRMSHFIIKLIFVSVVVLNIFYARERLQLRYNSWMNDYARMKDLYTVKPWLEASGISSNDTIIFYPSLYIRPLYLMNMKGWTISHDEIADTAIEKRDSMLMKTFVERGAEFLITNEIKSAMANKPFQPYLKDLYGKYNSIYIFRLPPRKINFSPADTLNMN